MTPVQQHNIRFALAKVRGLSKSERAEFYQKAREGWFGIARSIWLLTPEELAVAFSGPPPAPIKYRWREVGWKDGNFYEGRPLRQPAKPAKQ